MDVSLRATPALAGSGPSPPHVVAVFNSADDVIEMLSIALEGAGFTVFSAKLSEIQSGVLDLIAFVREHRPVAIVYDIPFPYEANWNFLRLMRETDSLSRLAWVLTTINKSALEAAVGPAPVLEIVLGTPFTAGEVVEAVRRSLSADGDGHDGDGHGSHRR
jgi:CheY-like chemotaxis protein